MWCGPPTGTCPRISPTIIPGSDRQVQAGCQAGAITVNKPCRLPGGPYEILRSIPFCRQVWLDPPIIIDPPTNKRTGEFQQVDTNPLEGMQIDPEEWSCYPAFVGDVVVFIYFHHSFVNLGLALSNLFELADDAAIERGPQAIYLCGAPPDIFRNMDIAHRVFRGFRERSDGGSRASGGPFRLFRLSEEHGPDPA